MALSTLLCLLCSIPATWTWHFQHGRTEEVLVAGKFRPSVPVETSRGPVVGMRLDPNPSSGVSYDAFLGVPYGTVPKRFERAVAREPWSEPLLALSDGPACPQANCSYSEDCLYLNIFTPPGASSERGRLAAVMAYIHGGAFFYGSSSSTRYGPDFLVTGDVVLVVINYRLGANGFMTLGSKMAPGNMGLHDTTLALQWIQEEIAKFGGDPRRVTVFGNSAGAAMALAHYLKPNARSLLTGVIAQSGSLLGRWATVHVAEGVRRTKQLARSVGCNDTTSNGEILACLRKVDIKDIIDNQLFQLPDEFVATGAGFQFVPVWDDLLCDRPFFPLRPRRLLRSAVARRKPIPLLTGFTTNEGISIFVTEGWKLVQDNLKAFLPPSAFQGLKGFQRDMLAQDIRREYFPQSLGLRSSHSFSTVAGLVRLYTHFMATYPAIQLIRLLPNTTYSYIFSYLGSWAPSPPYFPYNLRGVNHEYELLYLFRDDSPHTAQILDDFPDNGANLATMRRMVHWWTSFAKTGIPDPSWGTVASSGYRLIGHDVATASREAVELEYHDFWSELESMTPTSPLLAPPPPLTG